MKVSIHTPERAISLDFVAKATGGQLVLAGMTEAPLVQYACTDSREADEQTLFCAIRGERVDGHNYMASTQSRGCRAFLCEKIPQEITSSYAAVVVEDTVTALSKLARLYEQTYLKNLTTVAITGSVGKTTTKECVAAVLSAGFDLFKKEGNFNSTIGLPLSVLEIEETHTCAVLEMGMSGFGEISVMTNAVCPHIAMVTNIGHAHMELLGSRENIAKAKLEIAEGMREGDILLVNGDEPLLTGELMVPLKERGIKVVTVSVTNPNAHVYVHHVTAEQGGMRFALTMGEYTLESCFVPAMGAHMVWAAAFALTTGLLLGMKHEDVQKGLSSYTPAAMRQNVYVWKNVTIIEDCYNASPESMKAAFSVLALTAKARMIAVLGDMKELGEGSIALHRETGKALVALAQDRELYLLTIGELGYEIGKGACEAGLPQEHIYTAPQEMTYTQIAAHLASRLKMDDTILFKASRAMKLEEIITQLKEI